MCGVLPGIRQRHVDNDPGVSESSELFALACGPSQTPISFNYCVINGVRFVVHSRDERRTTKNSGICLPGLNGEMYYGQLEQILEFSYLPLKTVLFRVKWFDTSNKGRIQNFVIRNNITQIKANGEAFKNDQYILATQVKQCFYLEDMARRPLGWKVVEHVSHKKFLNGGVIVVEDDPDVIHVDNSSDLALSTSLNDLEIAALHIDGQSIDVDAPPDIIDVVDEDDDIIDEEDPIPHDLADSDDEDLVNLDIDDGVNVMSADVARGHGGDGGGDDRPPPYQVPTGCGGCLGNRGKGTRKPNLGGRRAGRPHTRQETRNLGLKAITDKSGPVPIRFEVNDRETLMPLGDHAAHWANYLGELVRELPLHYPSWRQMSPERKAGVVAKIGTQLTMLSPMGIHAGHKSIGGHPDQNLTKVLQWQRRLPLKKDIGWRPQTSIESYPSLITPSSFIDTYVGGVLLYTRETKLFMMRCVVSGLGLQHLPGVPYTEDEIMAIGRGGPSAAGATFPVLEGVCQTGLGHSSPLKARTTPTIARLKREWNRQKTSELVNELGVAGAGDDEPGVDVNTGPQDFEMLLNKVDLTEPHAVSMFMTGLKSEIGVPLRMKNEWLDDGETMGKTDDDGVMMVSSGCVQVYEALSLESNTQGSAEDSMKLKELMNIVPKLVSRIKTLETELQQTKTTYGKAFLTLVKRGRKIQDIDDDPLISLVRESMKEKSTDFVTPTKASGEAQEEDISPTILEAAKTLSKLKIQIQDKKAADYEEAIRLQAQMDEEVAKQIHLDKMLAKRVQEEQELATGEANTDGSQESLGRKYIAMMILQKEWSLHLKNQISWKLSQLKKLSFEELKTEFEKLMKRIESFVSMETEARVKRHGLQLEQETLKKQKIDIQDASITKGKDEVTAQDEFNKEREAYVKDKVKDASLESEIKVDVIPTATKPPTIVNWKIISQSSQKTMFDLPLSDDAIWSLPLQQKIINWRYYPTCVVHCLTLDASTIYMLADRKYPLSKDACQMMLKMKLLDGTMDEVCYQLLKMIEKQAGIRK
ncbi:reverse transcriptase domain-containing protein [Tanacetum coccineum]